MRRGIGRASAWTLMALGALACAGALPTAAGAAEPLRMTNLRVDGGEESWHASSSFRLVWDQVPGPPAQPRAVLYRVYDSMGHLVSKTVRDTKWVWSIEPLEVPPVPDAYVVEAWLEDFEGRAGPSAFATLRFDDVPPAAPVAAGPAGWSGTREQVPVKIGLPPGPPPLSGIRGYAVSLDQGAGSAPCSDPGWCAPAEIDLPAGSGSETVAVGPLPEGTTFARVVAVSGSGVPSAPTSVPLRIDGTLPSVTLQGLPDGWSAGPVRLSALAGDPLSGMDPGGAAGPFTAIAIDGAAPALALGDRVSAWVAGSGRHRVSYFARDGAGNVADGTLGPPPATAVVAIDEEPPRVAFAAAQDPADPERIEAFVSDRLSGPSGDRGTIRLRRAGTDAAFEVLPTRVVGERLVARWDSDSYSGGKYEFLATGYDRAGNAGGGGDRLRGAKMVLVNPLKRLTSLEAGFAGKTPPGQPRRARFGEEARFGGRLRTATGAAGPGLEIAVTEVFAPGSQPARRTTVTRTAADGSFSVALAPGPDREVLAAFAGNRTLTRSGSEGARLVAPALVRLRSSAATATVGGAPVVFSGRVFGPGAASLGDLPVELQFRYPGAGWSEFRTVETDAHGGFRYAYRFSDDDSRGVRFRFRAYVKGRESWPFEPAFSRPLAVLGR